MASNGLTPTTAAIVLVGGLSTRMGTDKASLVVDGMAMRDRVLAAATEAGIETVLVAGTHDVPDAVPESGERESRGPLAGIVGAWQALHEPRTGSDVAPYDPVVVLACDLPWLTADVIRQIVDASRAHVHGAVAHDGDRPQPLIAAYRPQAMHAMTTAFHRGERSIRRCSNDWDLGVVDADRTVVADADTPADLAGFRVEWPS